jgi:hypothetical protein
MREKDTHTRQRGFDAAPTPAKPFSRTTGVSSDIGGNFSFELGDELLVFFNRLAPPTG